MSKKSNALSLSLQTHFADRLQQVVDDRNEVTVIVAHNDSYAVLQEMRDQFDFEQLIDVCGVDYQTYGHADWETKRSSSGFSRGVNASAEQQNAEQHSCRFAVVYHLLSLKNNVRLRVRVYAEDMLDEGIPPRVDSVIELWSSANWFEREAFDLYGILFNNHPDLRRILTDYGFVGHPFRKDFPLIGEVEMRYDPEQKRVIYEPVSIEDRTLVARVIRQDNRYLTPEQPADAEKSQD